MGRLLLPLDMACRPEFRSSLTAKFLEYNHKYLIDLKLAHYDCDEAKKYELESCVICNNEPTVECEPVAVCSVFQTIYKCNQFTIKLPRVDGHTNLTINGKEYISINQVNAF